RAVVQALEQMVAESDFQAASAAWRKNNPHAPTVAVMALYPAQAALLVALLERSAALAVFRDQVEVGLPRAFAQRECLVALASLTRSPTNRAVPYGEGPRDLLTAFTRPVARLRAFGDPGTLLRRAQWHTPLDHLDEAASRREQALVGALVGYIQGHGVHQR